MFKNMRTEKTMISCPAPPFPIPPWLAEYTDNETLPGVTPNIVEEFARLRSLLTTKEGSGQDIHRVETALRAAERDRDWTPQRAMKLLERHPVDPSISYNIISILRILERRARRARLALVNNTSYTDKDQRDFWHAAIGQDLDDERGVAEDCPHWDSEVEDEIGRERLRAAIQGQIGTNSKRIERWLKNGERSFKM